MRHHFDEESQKLKIRINKGIELLNSKKLLLKVNIDVNYFYNSFHIELNNLKSELANLLEMQNKSFNTLILCLEDKKINYLVLLILYHLLIISMIFIKLWIVLELLGKNILTGQTS